MNIYFRFLNDNILLDNNSDNICGTTPQRFVEFIDEYYDNLSNSFIKIQHNNKDYYTHISSLQWCD